MPRVSFDLKTLKLIDAADAGLRPETVAARTPLAFDPPRRSDYAAPTGWVPLFLGLRSSAAQRRRGWWYTREDWMLPHLDTALGAMAQEASAGFRVGVLQIWAQCARLSDDVCLLRWPATGWRWGMSEALTVEPCGQPGAGYLYLRRTRRGSSLTGADRRGWVVRMLELDAHFQVRSPSRGGLGHGSDGTALDEPLQGSGAEVRTRRGRLDRPHGDLGDSIEAR